MALGDGSTWDETQPTDATNAVQIDDYNRDLRAGVRARMSNEHEWPNSQSSTSVAGMHKFMTLQAQSVKPTLSGTQVGAIYQDTSGQLCYENSAGTVVIITTGTSVVSGNPIGTASGDLVGTYPSPTVSITSTSIPKIYRYTSLSASTAIAPNIVKYCIGTASLGPNSSTNITNLPFSDATSYRLIPCYGTARTDLAESPTSINIDGASCTITSPDNSLTLPINWIAVGA